MKVWLVESGWDHDTVGVYASLESAKAAYPNDEWRESRNGALMNEDPDSPAGAEFRMIVSYDVTK